MKVTGGCINRNELYITTELPYAFQRSNKTGKSTIDLTLLRFLKNEQVKAKELEHSKSGHLAIEVLIEDTQNNLKHQAKFKTKNTNWENWQKHLTPHLSHYIDKFPDNSTEGEIETQTNLLTDIIVTTDTEYFGLIQASKKKKERVVE